MSRRNYFLYVCVILLCSVLRSWGSADITNVYVANVTPQQFSVFFQTEAVTTPEIELYSDASGSSNLVGQLGIEQYLLEYGDSSTTNAVDARNSRRQIAAQMSGKGLSLIRISGCAPNTTYYFRLKAYTNNILAAIWPETGLQAVTTAVRNEFAADVKQLLISVPGENTSGCVGILEYAGAAYPLASVVGDRAGDVELHFDLGNFFDTGGSNIIFTGNEKFNLTIYDSMLQERDARDVNVGFDTNTVIADAVPLISDAAYMMVQVGKTNILSNVASANVPISLISAPHTTNLSFELTIPVTALTNITLTAVSPEVGGARTEYLGDDKWRVVLDSVANSSIHSTTLEKKTVALLNFKPAPDVLTVLVPLEPALLKTLTPTNQLLTEGEIVNGEVQIITRRPYVQWGDSGTLDNISVSGIPGTEYLVEYSTNLLADSWQVTTNFTLGADELQTDVQLPSVDEEIYFIRIREKPAP